MSQLYYRRTDSSSYRDRIPLRIVRAESELSPLEKAYLGAVEKGDYASVKQALEVCAVSWMQSLLGHCDWFKDIVRNSFLPRFMSASYLWIKSSHS